MNEMTTQDRIFQLRTLLSEYNRLYYVENSPAVSDYEFDSLMRELSELEASRPDLYDPDSPTRKVGSDLETPAQTQRSSREFAHVEHRYPMLSLGNTYSISEIEDFAARVSKALEDIAPEEGAVRADAAGHSYCCELKFDGTAICLTYRGGVLIRALTRGDGTVGDDVTANVRRISTIPQRLKGSGYPDEFEIRGEIYMPWKAFDALNEEKEIAGEAPFANPRNAASGSLKLLDCEEVEHRGLECTLYHMLGENLPFTTHDEALKAAASWGLPISEHRKICQGIEQIEQYINYWDTERKKLPFATDGVVIKINELPLQRELGYTSKFPRWAVAFKFKAEQALTPVLGIDYQVGRTGAVTPVANLEPVPLSGTIVKRATLHNEEQMRLLDIRIGDWVYVEKGGEIIPKITGVELSRRPADAPAPEFPKVCPDCGTTLVRPEGEARWFCPNIYSCPTQIKNSLVHFASRKAMNFLCGEATVTQLYDLGLVRTMADFYDLTFTDLYRLQGFKDKSCERLLQSLQKSRGVPFEHVLFALAIRYVGETTAKSLARHFGSIDALREASFEELLQVDDIGEVIARSVVDWFASEDNLRTVQRLKDAGLQFSIKSESDEKLSDALDGCTVVITGNYSISRDEMKAFIEKCGGKASGSVSGKTTYVLAGDKPGAEKIRKAGELGIKIISEAELYALTGGIREVTTAQSTELTLF